jgi:hypothetical protein
MTVPLPAFRSPLILTGAYGSGKTEIAVALALACAATGSTTLVDLDFVTPYFRAQDCRPALDVAGVSLVAPDARVRRCCAPPGRRWWIWAAIRWARWCWGSSLPN